MIDIRHFIRADGGRIRVLRLVSYNDHTYPLRYHARRGPGFCASCGCTDRYACPTGCSWANESHTLCTVCLEKLLLP